ncbi:MAG: hypothetical protein ACJAYB_003085 [Psychromonas sp.]|jgi:hypothetical protein
MLSVGCILYTLNSNNRSAERTLLGRSGSAPISINFARLKAGFKFSGSLNSGFLCFRHFKSTITEGTEALRYTVKNQSLRTYILCYL